MLLVSAMMLAACNGTKYQYETVEGDPMNTQIYTLENGLKIYMTVNKEQPRIQTYIAVHAGGKDDPETSTGLAHYLEHLMFKGTTNFGTWNYEKEAVELAKIDSLYEIYNKETDAGVRKAIYHQIDSVSYQASRYSIANEYDKLMATIGASGTNAYTSDDVTCYTENIPSNQLENWARIQGDRFQNMVIRLFHTELEAVYEEKNIGMASDQDKIFEAMTSALYPNHPYGQHTVIGTQEHLKNPSIINIRKYFQNYYRPNNVAICLSGDFNPDEVVDIIQKYFGQWQPNDNITRNQVKPETEIKEPIVREVIGEESPNVWLAWRTPATKDSDNVVLNVISSILSNGQAGLMDLDLNQQQKVLNSACFNYTREDNSQFITVAFPMPGQSLDKARELLLQEIAKLRQGDFSEELVKSVITDHKLSEQKILEENSSRASQFVESFVNGMTWQEAVQMNLATDRVTKKDIVRVANKYLGDKNYVVVNKRQGVDPNIQKIEKPEISPVLTNRDSTSTFLREIQNSTVKPIEPVFMDFQKDLTFDTDAKGMPVIYKKNELNSLFNLTYVIESGDDADREIDFACQYMDYLGTAKMSAQEVKSAFYLLGCSFNIHTGPRRTYITVSGLDENKVEAIKLAEKVMAELKADAATLENVKAATLENRYVSLTDQNTCARYLQTYAIWGPEYVKAHTLSNDEIMALDAQKLVDKIQNLKNYKYTVTYYGPADIKDVITLVNNEHHTAQELKDVPEHKEFQMLPTNQNVVYLAHYNAPNIIMSAMNNTQKNYDSELQPVVTMYNEYFGGGMNGIVFQEIRESRGLAYSARAWFRAPAYMDRTYTFNPFVMTQVDKLIECNKAFSQIINDMPVSQNAFRIAKDALDTRFRTERTVRDAVIWAYIDARDLGLDYDINKSIFQKLQDMTMDDVKTFQQQYIKNRTYTYSIVANKAQIDHDYLQSMGQVKEVDIKDVTGF